MSLQCPISALLTLQRFEQHDSSLFSKANSRWTVDCVSFYDHISTNRSKVTTTLEQAVLERGPLVVNAVSEFIEAVTPGNNPAAHSMAGTIICGFKSSGSKAVVGNLRGLCMNALYRSRDLEELIGEVGRNGVFNREIAAMEVKASDMAGFRDFDPGTEQGMQRWVQLQELVVTFFGESVSRQQSEDKARAVLDALKIHTVSEYIPEEEEAHKDFRNAGGDISEADRIKVTKKKFGVKLKKAYDSFVEMKAIENGPDEMLEKRWGRFLTMLEKVGGAVGPEGKMSAAHPDATTTAARQAAAARQRAPAKDRKGFDKDLCWEHTYGGHCTFGDRCRYGGHDEPAGSRMLEVADEFSVCLNFLEHGGCHRLERGKCPFTHGEDDTMTALSAEQHTAIVNYAEAKGREAHSVKLAEVTADGGVAKWKTAAEKQQPQKPRVFPVLQPRPKSARSYKEVEQFI